jgi:hypothetical protein
MMRDKLSKREDRALLRALREVVLTHYPNPERKECPGTAVIRAIATKHISMLDPAHEHVGSCSPCFKELTEMRQSLHRRNIFVWTMATTGAAIVILAVVLQYSGFRSLQSPLPQETVQTAPPGESQPPIQSEPPARPPEAGQTQPSTPPTRAPEPRYETALLDLRNASATRTVESIRGSNISPAEIPRGLLALTVQLPVGSDSGAYDVQIRDSNQQPVRTAQGEAIIESGITRLPINLDTRSLQPGEYEFAWRRGDFSWRNYPILIR